MKNIVFILSICSLLILSSCFQPSVPQMSISDADTVDDLKEGGFYAKDTANAVNICYYVHRVYQHADLTCVDCEKIEGKVPILIFNSQVKLIEYESK